MNRLLNTKCYLSGAMDRVIDNGIGWRKDITPFLKSLGILVFDPCNKPLSENKEDINFRELKKQLRQKEDWDELKYVMKPVRRVDLRMCDESSFLIVNLDMEIHPCGTYEELFCANSQRKPIIIRCEQGKKNIPDWLFAVCPHELFFDTWDQVKEYIVKVNNGQTDDCNGRWVFWDWDM